MRLRCPKILQKVIIQDLLEYYVHVSRLNIRSCLMAVPLKELVKPMYNHMHPKLAKSSRTQREPKNYPKLKLVGKKQPEK